MLFFWFLFILYIAFPKYFGALHIEKELFIENWHLVAGAGLGKILGDTYIDIAGLQTANVDVNCIYKARYSVLPLFLWADERPSFSRMFKYWMLIMKFQIDCFNFLRYNWNKITLNSFLAGKLLAHDFGGAVVLISVNGG